MTAETGTMGDELLVTDPVTRARNGDKQAWDALVERYAPLVWSICRRHRLGSAEASDVGQTVWLRLLDELATVRDQAALPGWLATATLRECGRVLRAAGRQQAAEYMLDAGDIPGGPTGMVQHELRMAERNAALRGRSAGCLAAASGRDAHGGSRRADAEIGAGRHPGREHRAGAARRAAAPLSGGRRPDGRRSPGSLNSSGTASPAVSAAGPARRPVTPRFRRVGPVHQAAPGRRGRGGVTVRAPSFASMAETW
jgi:DNA-directed RNA polymerase specialized sigma24 family protein